MRPSTLLLAVSLALSLAVPARAADPRALLARSKQAAGGARWDAVTFVHATGTLVVTGLTGRLESWLDLRRGRYVTRATLGPTSQIDGFDGALSWVQEDSGEVRLRATAAEREDAVNEAYRTALAYWYPERWPALVQDAGTREAGGRRFAVVRVTPDGGRPFELWLDAASGRIDHWVEKAGAETLTAMLEDYREVDGRAVAFRTRLTTGQSGYEQVAKLETVRFDEPADESRFVVPAAAAPARAVAPGR